MSARGEDRVDDARGLGQGDRGLDLVLGAAGFLPLAILGVGAWLLPRELRGLADVGSRAWAAGLLCFLAGVRRGLTFSERRGASTAEVATFLALFFTGVTGWLFPPLLMLGLFVAGMADAIAARRAQAPRYFTWLRPAQALVALTGLASVQVAMR